MSCELYSHNVLPILVVEKHHIVPESWWKAAGKPVATPFAHLCPTCHTNVHWWIDQIIVAEAHGTALPILKPYRAYKLAVKGIELGRAAGLTPRRTL